MSNKISRRTFLKCTGASAAALGTAALLGGCQSSSNASVEVKVGDKVSNWNNLGVQLTSVFTLTSAPDVPGHEYVAVLVTAVIVYTFVCLFTGNITPLSRVTAMLTPVWFVAELTLLCTLL